MTPKTEPNLKTSLLSNARICWPVIFITLATIFVFLPALENGFYGDDNFTIVNNYNIRNLSALKELFSLKYFSLSNEASFRPAATFFYILEYKIFKLNPAFYHLFNIIIHLFNAALVFYLINIFSKNSRLAFLSALIFAVHPVQSEVVNGISFSEDLLAVLFMGLSLVGILKYLQYNRTKYFIFSLIFFLLSLLSKESALVYPVLAGGWYVFRYIIPVNREKTAVSKEAWTKILVTMVFIVGFYSWIRFFVFQIPQSSNYIQPDFIKRLFFSGELLFRYLNIIVNPWLIKPAYPLSMQFGPAEYWHIGVVFIILVTGFGLIIRSGSRLLFFSSTAGIMFLVPVLGLFYPLYTKMANRFLYLPLVGVSFLGACFILYGAKVLSLNWRKGSQYKTLEPALNQDSRRINPENIIMSLFAGIFFLASTGFIHKDLNFRKNDVTFLREVVKQYPQHDFYKLELAIALYNDNAGQNIPAIKMLLDESRQIQKDEFLFNLLSGLVCSLEQKYPLALEYLKKAEAKKSNFHYQNNALYFALGQCYYNLKKINPAKGYYLKTLKADPNHLKAINSLGILYASIGEYDLAEEWLRKGLDMDPHNTNILHNLELIQKRQKRLP